eukprot:9246820-Ditylum_brightwellii.AAC.1
MSKANSAYNKDKKNNDYESSKPSAKNNDPTSIFYRKLNKIDDRAIADLTCKENAQRFRDNLTLIPYSARFKFYLSALEVLQQNSDFLKWSEECKDVVQKCKENIHDYILKVRELDVKRTIDERFKEKQFKNPTTLTRITGASSKEDLIEGFEESKNPFKELIDKGNTESNTITIELLEDTPQPAVV